MEEIARRMYILEKSYFPDKVVIAEIGQEVEDNNSTTVSCLLEGMEDNYDVMRSATRVVNEK